MAYSGKKTPVNGRERAETQSNQCLYAKGRRLSACSDTMTEIQVTDPILLKVVEVSDNGRIYVGTAHSGREVTLTLSEPGNSQTVGQDDEQDYEQATQADQELPEA